jgi:hypothetical protein
VSIAVLVRRLVNLIRAKNATTFYLNGPPGSGKSHLLKELARQLPTEIPRALVLGPYPVTWAEVTSLGERLIQDCRDAGFFDELSPRGSGLDLVSAWQWLRENAQVSTGQSFLVLIDLVEANQLDLPTISSLFSGARYLEGAWSQRDMRIFHMFAGYWDHPGLERHFHSINTSFPYTVGHNYITWRGLSIEEMIALANQVRPEKVHPLRGRLLFELTGGHPAAALDILNQIASGPLGFPALLSSTYQAAANGPAGQTLIGAWCQLPAESRSVLRDLVLQRRMPAKVLPAHLERLRLAGVIQLDQVGAISYLNFRSWYAELLVRLHAEELGIADEQTQRIQIAELMPKAFELNVEAYRLISDIENQARNFVAVQLCLRQTHGEPILKERSKKYNDYKRVSEDAHQRAMDWQTRSAGKGLPVALNPLLAYLSTRDLADLIVEIGIEMRSEAWQRIAQAIQDLSGVRDAVMHNQLIDDAALQRLYDLQADIYEALSETE